jgi:primosomal protein N' (replication factor Y)
VVPEGLAASVGSIVRVPLGGRRVRGYVVSRSDGDPSGLKEVLGVSGGLPVFGPDLLEVLRWAAVHYVAPLAALLGKAAPPNLPRRPPGDEPPPAEPASAGPLPELSAAAAAGRHTRAHYWLGGGPWGGGITEVAGPVLEAGRSVMVVAPSLVEGTRLVEELRGSFGRRVVLASSGLGNAEVTAAWGTAATHPGTVLVGTRDVAFWPVASLGLAVLVGEGRRGMKDKATPTTHAREVLWRRSAVERFPLLLCGAVPTGAALERGPVVVRRGPGKRTWGLVEVVDRREHAPGGGLVSEPVRRALHAVVASGRRALVFTDRRMPATRCVRCRRLRACPECEARPGRDSACPRCGTVLGGCAHCGGMRFEPLGAGMGRVLAELGGFLGRDVVGEAGTGRQVVVGTERDLPLLGPIDLSVVVDADGPLRAPNYRALEDGLRLLARVVLAAGTGRGRRAFLQTADPDHPAITALRRGDPLPALEEDLAARTRLGLPPGGELLVVETAGAPERADAQLRETLGSRAHVLGPAERGNRLRWLIQGRDLRAARLVLRTLVHEWRDRGIAVRIDADPIDL